MTTKKETKIIEDLKSKLGRKATEIESKDKEFLIRGVLPRKIPRKGIKSYYGSKYYLEQPSDDCVGFSLTHLYVDGPVTHNFGDVDPGKFAHGVYLSAQKIDEWPGEDYGGTSVRAGAEIMKQMGIFKEYRWAWDLQTAIDAMLTMGPLVSGIDWYYDMFFPDKKGKVSLTGGIAGGHAIEVIGINTIEKEFDLKNSWGKGWGRGGRCTISFDDMGQLISQQGEILIAVENKIKTK